MYAIFNTKTQKYFCGFDKQGCPQWGEESNATSWANKLHAICQMALFYSLTLDITIKE
jgi:hypothetical protein